MRSNITELPDISLSGIYKTYGYQDNMTYALNNINLDVVKGEFLALLIHRLLAMSSFCIKISICCQTKILHAFAVVI